MKYKPVTKKIWADFEKLFGSKGACGGCWCMSWRLAKSEFDMQKGEMNKQAMKKIVDSGTIPGILLYDGSEPFAWCSIAPREDFPRLEKSKILAKVDEKPVWAIVCLFVAKDYRNKGISAKILEAAIAFAKNRGAEIVEGYPFEPKDKKLPGTFFWTGIASAFKKAGFVEIARRSQNRPIMRFYIKKDK